MNIFYFIFGILAPHLAEEYAYAKWISAIQNRELGIGNRESEEVAQGYGWRLIWDAAYYLGIFGAGYRIIATSASLSAWEWLGYFCFLAGTFLRIWSLKELGQFYDPGIVIKAEHQIIQAGPYRALRHPLHLGTLLKISGLASFLPLWLASPAALASLVLCLYLNRAEDKIHARRFGDSFKAYYSKTWDVVDLIFWKGKFNL